jgi:D-alanyl-D-alanine carboxypeptidase
VLTAGHRRRRRWGQRATLVLVVACAVGAGVGFFALRGDDGGALGSGSGREVSTAPVERLTTPVLERPPVQAAVGPLPDPPGAARVDLSRPSLLPALTLHPSPQAGLAFDLADGSVLWRHGATRVLPIASLTKLMTGLLAVERFGPHDRVRMTFAADSAGGTHMGGLLAGRRVRAETLLQGLMISSGNDAAVALAVGGAGSIKAWVARMNRRAQLLGLSCTHFVDPSGLDPRNRSCPADVAALAVRAIAEPRLRRIARRRFARVWPGGGKTITLRTTNHLLRERYPGAIGLKTGFTNAAGHCLVAIIQRGSRKIGIVLLGSKRDAFADARRIAREAARAGVMPPAT